MLFLLVLLCAFGSYCSSSGSSRFVTTVSLISVDVPDGLLMNGRSCLQSKCSLSISLCIEQLESDTSPITCTNNWMVSSKLTNQSNSFEFSKNVLYGGLQNPVNVSFVSRFETGFLLKCAIYDTESSNTLEIDRYVTYVGSYNDTVITYVHPRDKAGPTYLKFSWINPYPKTRTTSLPNDPTKPDDTTLPAYTSYISSTHGYTTESSHTNSVDISSTDRPTSKSIEISTQHPIETTKDEDTESTIETTYASITSQKIVDTSSQEQTTIHVQLTSTDQLTSTEPYYLTTTEAQQSSPNPSVTSPTEPQSSSSQPSCTASFEPTASTESDKQTSKKEPPVTSTPNPSSTESMIPLAICTIDGVVKQYIGIEIKVFPLPLTYSTTPNPD